MWFSCVVIGTIATTVIIFNLWEKFQTNPTITGLDTDFHNWDVAFPGVTICPQIITTEEKINEYLSKLGHGNDTELVQFVLDMTQLSYLTWDSFVKKYIEMNIDHNIFDGSIKELIFMLASRCDELFVNCQYKSDEYDCCELFFPVFTEIGFCYTFNSKHYERRIPGIKEELPAFNRYYIKETDLEWSLKFSVTSLENIYGIYILNSDEIAGIDVQPQHIWDLTIEIISFSVKQTYTTVDTEQLSIKQRRCTFSNEIKLQVDDEYTYSACTRECRMNTAQQLCKCIPYFYPEIGSFKHCGMKELECIQKHLDVILSVDKCSCYLGCSNTVYEAEKFDQIGNAQGITTGTMDCHFISWPMVRFKREVLFGWVDLLVSFGGIAGLFLGFSLLSGVEILYYFTVRACCMIVRERQELRKIQLEKSSKLIPDYDLSLVPYFISDPLPGHGINEIAKNFYRDNLHHYSNKISPAGKHRTLKQPSEAFVAPFGIEFLN